MFKQKIIKVTLKLNEKDEYFTIIDDEKMNRVSHTGLRVSVLGNYGNGATSPSAVVTIYGLPIEKIDKIIRIKWGTKEQLMSKIKVEVGEQGQALEHFYSGTIIFARLDTTSAPDIALVIESLVALREQNEIKPGTVFDEGVTVQEAIEFLCNDMGYTFENNGVDKTMSGFSLQGSNLEKIKKLCRSYSLDYYLEHQHLAIANKGEPRELEIPVVSPSNGLLSYPTSNMQGVSFQCLYNPLVRFGGRVEIRDSVVERANAVWQVYGLRTHLEANTPNGNWSMEVNATYVGGAAYGKS